MDTQVQNHTHTLNYLLKPPFSQDGYYSFFPLKSRVEVRPAGVISVSFDNYYSISTFSSLIGVYWQCTQAGVAALLGVFKLLTCLLIACFHLWRKSEGERERGRRREGWRGFPPLADKHSRLRDVSRSL